MPRYSVVFPDSAYWVKTKPTAWQLDNPDVAGHVEAA
jgi:hypothetical protein